MQLSASMGETIMTDEIGTAGTATDKARIWRATEAIQDMAQEMANDLRPAARGLEPMVQRLTDDLCKMTRQAPLQSLAIAFLLGILVARRR
jgi:hypothetical protein